MLEIRLAGSRNIRKKLLVHTKYSKFSKEVMNTYFNFFSIKMETVMSDSESLSVVVLKSICLGIVKFETNFHRVHC
jgi:hypothetical protein